VTRPAAPQSKTRPSVNLGAAGPWLAPVLSIVGLLLVAFVTITLLQCGVPFTSSNGNGNGNGNGHGGPAETPAPSNVVIVPPEVVTFKGSIVYAKAGNVWVQTGKDVKQLTKGGDDSMPSWSPDGASIYFIRTANGDGQWTAGGVVRDYALTTPSVMQVKADGSADPVRVLNGKVSLNGHTWQSWIREPVVSPDGTTLAMVSDRPNPSVSDVVLQLYDLTTKKSTIPKVAETPPLGHQDPTWRPDGKFLMYVRNGRDGARGAPMIYRYDVAKGKSAAVTGPGYLEPSYSQDGRFVVATKTSSFGNDLVILDAGTGRELLRLTNDGASWSPVWSPIGDAIAFLHLQGQIVDLKMIRLDGAAPNWTVKDITDLTEVSGLDGSSRPDWFVPSDQLPEPTPTPVSSVAPSGVTASPSAQ
jgi:dipeptidyl aminopeptidase/acylaminoacyl peptidase